MYTQYVVFALNAELKKRKSQNPRYSNRAFAKQLGLDASLLAKILTGKRLPTAKVVLQIEKKFGVKISGSKNIGASLGEVSPKPTYVPSRELAEFFNSGWEPYAFWARIRSGTFTGDAKDLAQEFALPQEKAQIIYDTLMSSGLCKRNSDGKYEVEDVLISNAGLKNFSEKHFQMQKAALEMAMKNLHERKEESHFSSMVFRMNPQHLDLAKNISGLFRRQSTYLLEGLGEPAEQEVFSLQISLSPLSAKNLKRE